MAKTPQQMADAYRRGMAGAGQSYKDGIAGVTESPTQKAASADAMDRYARGCQQSVSDGTRAAALQSVTLQQWKDAATAKAGRLVDGANAAQNKVLAHFQAFGPVYAQASAAAAAVSKDDPLGRVRAAINVLRAGAGKPPI